MNKKYKWFEIIQVLDLRTGCKNMFEVYDNIGSFRGTGSTIADCHWLIDNIIINKPILPCLTRG